MKIDREEIKGLHVSEYASSTFRFRLELLGNMGDLVLLESARNRHLLSNYNFDVFYNTPSGYKSEWFKIHYAMYEKASKRWHAECEQKAERLEKHKMSAREFLLDIGVIGAMEIGKLKNLDIIYLLEKHATGEKEKYCEFIYNSLLEYYEDSIEEREKFNNTAKESEIKRLENKDFNFAQFITAGKPCTGLLYKDGDNTMKIAEELAELTYYKSLVTDNEYTKKQENNDRKTISQRLDLLKSKGVFTLPAFQIDNQKTDNSIRKISRLLSDILGESDETIRTVMKRKGMNFNKGT